MTENIFAGLEIARGGMINRREMRAKTEEVLAYLRCDFSPDDNVGQLPSGQKKMVEIAKALVFQRKIVILDEPTASFSVSRSICCWMWSKSGLHRPRCRVHIASPRRGFRIADRVTVLRDGEKIITCPIEDIDEPQLIRYMVGRDASVLFAGIFEPGEIVLEARNLTGNGVEVCRLPVRRREIVGFAGMVGSGRSER